VREPIRDGLQLLTKRRPQLGRNLPHRLAVTLSHNKNDLTEAVPPGKRRLLANIMLSLRIAWRETWWFLSCGSSLGESNIR
jgi:hypothetical protein